MGGGGKVTIVISWKIVEKNTQFKNIIITKYVQRKLKETICKILKRSR